MRSILNERGTALTYVLMISVVLMILTPTIIYMTSTDAFRNKTDSNSLIATNLAVSGMESLLGYLASYVSGDKEDFLENYPGMDILSYSLPEGTPVTYSMSLEDVPGGEPGDVAVVMTATIGTGSMERSEQVVYTLETDSAAPSDDEDDSSDLSGRYHVPVDHDTIYYYSESMNKDVVADEQQKDNLSNAVESIMNEFVSEADEIASAHSCTSSECRFYNVQNPGDFANVENYILGSGQDPVVVEINGMNIGTSEINWGTPEKPVIVIVNGSVNFNTVTEWNVYGDIIFKNTFSVSGNGTKLNVYAAADGSYGNIIAKDSVNTNQHVTIDAEHLFYIEGNATFTNTYVFSEYFVVKNKLTTNNGGDTIITTDMDMIFGEVLLGDSSSPHELKLNAIGGDILTKGNFHMNHKTNVSAGGLIVVGGNFSNDGQGSTMYSGGGTTSIVIEGETFEPVEEDEVQTPVDWNPVRIK